MYLVYCCQENLEAHLNFMSPDEIKNIAGSLDIVIPVFRALDYLQKCLETLDAVYPKRNLILVSDGDAESYAYIEQYLDKNHDLPGSTRHVPRERRGWFTRAVNTGLKESLSRNTSEWVVVLNTDCEIGSEAFEEMLGCWDVVENQMQLRVGCVGSHGPQPKEHPRMSLMREPGYVTMHGVLFNKQVMLKEGFRFPQNDNEVKGFSAHDLKHISSDRALSYWMNRKGYATILSYWSAIGHHGGRSWNYNLGEVYALKLQDLGD